jgi:hypothetical protein
MHSICRCSEIGVNNYQVGWPVGGPSGGRAGGRRAVSRPHPAAKRTGPSQHPRPRHSIPPCHPACLRTP